MPAIDGTTQNPISTSLDNDVGIKESGKPKRITLATGAIEIMNTTNGRTKAAFIHVGKLETIVKQLIAAKPITAIITGINSSLLDVWRDGCAASISPIIAINITIRKTPRIFSIFD
jgi:hypothetical protein